MMEMDALMMIIDDVDLSDGFEAITLHDGAHALDDGLGAMLELTCLTLMT